MVYLLCAQALPASKVVRTIVRLIIFAYQAKNNDIVNMPRMKQLFPHCDITVCTGQNTENTYSISINVKIYSEKILMYFIAVFHFRLRALLFLDMRFIRFTSLFMCESCRVRLCVVRFVIQMEILYHLKLQVTMFEV